MARPYACYRLCQNPPLAGKNEFAGTAPTEGSGIPTPTFAV